MSQSASFGPITIHPMAYLRGATGLKKNLGGRVPPPPPLPLFLVPPSPPAFYPGCSAYSTVQYSTVNTYLVEVCYAYYVASGSLARGGYLGSASSWSSLPPLSTSYHGACACACTLARETNKLLPEQSYAFLNLGRPCVACPGLHMRVLLGEVGLIHQFARLSDLRESLCVSFSSPLCFVD